MTEPLDLAAVLVDLGVPRAEIETARAAGALELLALEKVVSLEDPRFDIDEVAALSGIDADRIREYWRALGFPDPRPGEKLFTEGDVEMLSAIMTFIAEGALDPDLAVQMARVIGSALDRIAAAQVDAIEARRVAEPGARPPASARATAEVLALMPKVMEYVWRRQLASAARRRMTRSSGDDGGDLVVGFADLVGFTAKTQQLEEHELAEVVGRFEAVAYDVVTEAGGRVVKMIGDEVMFTHDDITRGAELALGLADAFRSDPNLSDVRVGLACGPALQRDGDVYGPVVNLASRIVTIAYPATVVVSQEVFEALRGDDRFVLRTLRSHYLKDIGRVSLWALRSPGGGEAPYRDERHRRAARQFLLERWAELRRDPRQWSTDEVMSTELLEAGLDADGTLSHGAGSDEGGSAGIPTGQYEAITEAVLESHLDPELQVELLGELEAARRLQRLEHEAQQKAAEADLEAERRLEEIEREAHRRVEEAEREARRKVEQALEEAEAKSKKVNEEATRKVQRVAEKVERQADRVEKEAKVEAERKAKRKRGKDKKKRG